MQFLADNCVREFKCPTGKINGFDYSIELDLIASFRHGGENIHLWNPDSGEIVGRIYTRGIQDDVLFLPGNFVAVLWNPTEFKLLIYSVSTLEKVIEIALPFSVPMPLVLIARAPINNLLVASNSSIVMLDLEVKKSNQYSSFLSYNSEYLYAGEYIQCMCCSTSNYDVCIAEGQGETYSFKCLRVDSNSPDRKHVTSGQDIAQCFIDGKQKEFGKIRSLAHDSENVLVATEDEVILLESATEVSKGHVILSSGIATDKYYGSLKGEMKANNKGQLLVSDGTDTIKLYEYKRPVTLKALCRGKLNTILKHKKEKIEYLPIPRRMKNFLLYKD